MPGVPLNALDNLKGKLKKIFSKSKKEKADKPAEAAKPDTTAAPAAAATGTETAPAGKLC
ncbi:hypothetical protein GGR53DRAFT_477579 [Hypoxylon sp. FL1150]|nr:hypothetical protein GGR53DRAFT_477579 [Hypoxylon sp. FL1150]